MTGRLEIEINMELHPQSLYSKLSMKINVFGGIFASE